MMQFLISLIKWSRNTEHPAACFQRTVPDFGRRTRPAGVGHLMLRRHLPDVWWIKLGAGWQFAGCDPACLSLGLGISRCRRPWRTSPRRFPR